MDNNPASLYEDELYGMERESTVTIGYVTFRLGDEWYGLPMSSVREVVPVPSITLIPHVPEHIVGIANLRGTIISITNLKTILHVFTDTERVCGRVIIIGGEPTMTGLLVDGSEHVVQIDAENIQKPGESDRARKPFIDGFFAQNDRLIALLNVDRILSFTSLKPSADQTQGALS